MTIDASQDGPWKELFVQAMRLMAALPITVPTQVWSFGGGTVLMLRHRHRQSKDIDLFIGDPQLLGYLNPRLSDAAASITDDYDEASEYIKLFLEMGEIDVVVSKPLTQSPYEKADILGYPVLVEKSAEIIAKKMYYRGNKAKGRDLFDFALVIEREPDDLICGKEFLLRYRKDFLAQLKSREQPLRTEFDAIDTLDYQPSFDECVRQVRAFLESL
jgi:hypothetical protein